MTDNRTIEAIARGALERVCSGACPNEMDRYYSPSFVDHVNGAHLNGFDGIARSVAQYRRLLRGLTITVLDQMSAGDQVLCRFCVTGQVYGRRVRFEGMTLSRFENGLIVEDWSITDALSILKQVGMWRALMMLLRSVRT